MSGACNMHERNENCTQSLSENMKRRNYLGDLALDGRILLKLILNKSVGDVERIDLAQCKDQWLAVVNTAKNLRVP